MSVVPLDRRRANSAHIRLSRPDSGLGSQVKVLKTSYVVPSSLGSGNQKPGGVWEMCSGSEAGSYLRLIDFVYLSTLGLKVIKKKKKTPGGGLDQSQSI